MGCVLESPTIPPGASVFFSGTLTKFLVHPGDEMRRGGKFKPRWCLVKAGCWCSEKGSGQQWGLRQLLTSHRCTSAPPERFHWEGKHHSGIQGGSVSLISCPARSGVSGGAGTRS